MAMTSLTNCPPNLYLHLIEISTPLLTSSRIFSRMRRVLVHHPALTAPFLDSLSVHSTALITPLAQVVAKTLPYINILTPSLQADFISLVHGM